MGKRPSLLICGLTLQMFSYKKKQYIVCNLFIFYHTKREEENNKCKKVNKLLFNVV